MKKRMRVAKVSTEDGKEISVVFRPVIIDDNEPDERKNRLVNGYVCTTDCKYRDICKHLTDPRTPGKGEFVSCCNDMVNNDVTLAEMVPADDSLENAGIPGFEDIYSQVVKKNPLLPLSKIIDTLCPGTCSLYRKDHSLCRKDGNNFLCILNGLFMDPDKKVEENEG